MYRDGALGTYLEDAASGKPAPGGGSVSALTGALAASMSEMSANFTVGKKKFAAVDAEVRALLVELQSCRETLFGLVDRDVTAYGAVNTAYSLPKGTDAERAERRDAIQAALRGAMQVPLDVMRQCAGVADVAARLVGIGNPNLITDVGVSAILAEAACAAARLNVEVNLKYLKDDELAARTREEMDGLTRRAADGRRSVEQTVGHNLAQ